VAHPLQGEHPVGSGLTEAAAWSLEPAKAPQLPASKEQTPATSTAYETPKTRDFASHLRHKT
jgi:hypothetical protein